MKLNSKVVAVILVTILFGGIGISKALGVWHTESTKIPAKYTSGEFAGQYNPEDIRGSFVFQDIFNSFDVPVEVLAKAFGVNVTDPESYPVKDLGLLYADLEAQGITIETASVRHFVALYKGLPYTATEETYFPISAVEILKEKGNISPEQLDYLEKHTVEVNLSTDLSTDLSSSPSDTLRSESTEENSESTDRSIKGNTTFKEVLDLGVPKAEIEAILGEEIPSTGLTIRDYCVQKEVEFSEVKTALQKKVDVIAKQNITP